MSDEGTRIMAPGELPSVTLGASPPPPSAAPNPPSSPPPSRPPGGEAASVMIGPGSLIANTYVLERRLGGGGMGEVYLAQHTSLKTQHAVKMIRPSMLENTQVMDLFYREARVLRNVRHDAVVNYDGFVRDEQGREFLVMEYVDGTSLAALVKGVPCDPADVLTLRERLCAGLAEAHRRGAVHRDLSPDNVILPGGRFEAAKIIDFGLCKLTDPGQETIVGDSFAGKYRYAAPEQFGLYGGAVDARSDIYSLGLVLVAAARGRPLDMGDSLGAAITSRQQVPDLSRVPPALRDWLSAMLQPNPADRPPSVAALLERWPAYTVIAAAGTPSPGTGAGRPTADQPNAAPARRRLAPLLGLILLGGAAVGGGVYWWGRPLPASAPPLSAPVPSASPAAGVATGEPKTPPPPGGAAAGASAGPAPGPTPVQGPAPGPGPDPVAATPPEAPTAEPPEQPAGDSPAAAATPPSATAATPAPAATSTGTSAVTADAAPDRGPAPAVPANIGAVLRSFQCPALQASLTPGGPLVVSGQVRSGEKANLYERLSTLYPARVDVTAVTTQPWPRCALAPAMAARLTGAPDAPRIALSRDRTSFKLGERLEIRILSTAPREGHISLAYIDAAGEVFHILPYAGEPDTIAARGTLPIAAVVAEPPVGSALLIATWCSGALYQDPPPEKEPVARFMTGLTAALDAHSLDCAASLLDLEIRAR